MSEARIVDRSYRPYEGARGGVGNSMATVIKHSIQRALGIKRSIWHAVLPLVTAFIAYLPAIVFVGIAALDKEGATEDILPSYGEYYGFTTVALLIFAAFVAPEIVCTDRRTGMLGLYLASPLDRNTYLASKAISIGAVLTIVTTGPLLLMLLANSIVERGPGDVVDWIVLLGRIVVSGLAVSALYTALTLAVSSFTTRRAAASATIVLLLLTCTIFVATLTDPDSGPGWSPNLVVFDLVNLSIALALHIFGEGQSIDEPYDAASSMAIVAGAAGWVVVCGTVAWYRYRTISVTK